MFDYVAIKKEALQREHSYLKKLATPEAKYFVAPLYYEYVRIGQCDLFLKEDIQTIKKWFYKAAWLECLEFKIASGKIFSSHQLDKPMFSSTSVRGFVWSVISSSDLLIYDYCSNVNPSGDYGHYLETYGYYVSFALKYLLLNQTTEAAFYVEKALEKKAQKTSGYYKGFAIVIKGILDKNENMIQDGLKIQINSHKKLEKGSPFYEIDLISTALAIIAAKFNVLHNLPSNFVDGKIFFDNDSIPYFEIPEVLTALCKRI